VLTTVLSLPRFKLLGHDGVLATAQTTPEPIYLILLVRERVELIALVDRRLFFLLCNGMRKCEPSQKGKDCCVAGE